MTQLTLTKKQQDRLILMCLQFYPEYLASFGALPNGMMVFRKHLQKDYEYMHWFEFCMLQLSDRVYVNLKQLTRDYLEENGLKSLGKYLLKPDEHLVDSLYTFVERCNKSEAFINSKPVKTNLLKTIKINEKAIPAHRTAILA